MQNIAYKFVSHPVPELDELCQTSIYRLKVKLLSGEKLTRKEKDDFVYFNKGKNFVRLHGWHFGFREFMTQFVVKQYGNWQEYWAFDKTSLRQALYGKPDQIVVGYSPEK